MKRLAERVAIVTGGGSGIGRATAWRFASEGARVALFDRDATGLDKTAALISAAGGEAISMTLDLTSADEVREGIAQVTVEWGRLDVVFNGAGVSGRQWGDGPVHECADEAWERVIDSNLTSVFLVCKHAVPLLLAGGGAVINLASVLGLVGGDEDFATHAYAASKGGIIALSRAMASYYAPRGLRVNVIAPGLIATPMSARVQSDARLLARLAALQPLGGELGRPEDVAAAAAYLASDDARFVTGAVLTVDGGWTVR